MANDLIVVIATAGRADLLSRTLTSLSACRQPDIYRETIVVENGPKAGAEEVVWTHRSDLNARYHYVSEANKSHALNAVLDTIGDCLIFFTDDDVRIHPETLDAYAQAAKGIDAGQFYGGPVGVDYDQTPPEWLKRYLPPSAAGWTLDGAISAQEGVICFLGFNWAAFANDMKEAGGFDPNFGPGSPTGSRGQEYNMQKRLWKMGTRQVYVPDALVWHYVPPERCSPKWALKRIYQTSLEWGIGEAYQGAIVLGYPRWMFRELLKASLRVMVRSMRTDPQVRFDAYYRFLSHLGHMRGSRIQ